MGDGQDDLVRQAAAGDDVALTLLLTQSRGALRDRIARRIALPFQGLISADDVVQEAHAEVFRRIKDFKPEGPDAFDRWLMTIAIRRLRSAIKRLRAAKRGGGQQGAAGRSLEDSTIALLDVVAGSGKTPSRVMSRREALQAMESAMGKLPEHYGQAIRLVHIERQPVREAAAKMNRTERAVHGLCRRGLEQLKNELGTVSDYLSSSG